VTTCKFAAALLYLFILDMQIRVEDVQPFLFNPVDSKRGIAVSRLPETGGIEIACKIICRFLRTNEHHITA